MYAKREFFHFIKVALGRLVYARSDTTLSAEREVYRLNVLASATLSKGGSARNDLKSGVTRVTYRHRYALRSTPAGACGRCSSVTSARQTMRHRQPNLHTVSTPARHTMVGTTETPFSVSAFATGMMVCSQVLLHQVRVSFNGTHRSQHVKQVLAWPENLQQAFAS